MVLVQEDNEAGALRVEGRRNMKKSLLGEIGNLLVGDGRLLVQLVVGAALLDSIEERLLVGHGGGCC